MRSTESRNLRGSGVAPMLLPWDAPLHWGSQREALEACLARWRAYESAEVDMAITPHDDMLVDTPEGRAHYRAVGLSALRLVTDAMVLTGNTRPQRILDLPCGGGRVTRHLVRFFPDAATSVSDLDERKVAAVVEQFGVEAITASRDFTAPLPGSYDLIFVGSLVTHLDTDMLTRAFHRLVEALNPGGVLILTTTGRQWASLSQVQDRAEGLVPHRWWSPALSLLSRGRIRSSRRLAAVEGAYARSGFAYVEVRSWTKLYGQSYGGVFASPSWLMRLVEQRTDTRVIGYKERGFADQQDALLLQRAS